VPEKARIKGDEPRKLRPDIGKKSRRPLKWRLGGGATDQRAFTSSRNLQEAQQRSECGLR